MRFFTVVLLGLVAGACAKSVAHYGAVEECTALPAFDQLSHKLGDLTADVVDFEDMITAGGDRASNVDNQLREIKTRINNLEGSGCDDRTEFQCGGFQPKCVSRLLVCDGEAHCENAADETQCAVLTPTDSTWIADMIYDHCTKLRPDTFELHIESYNVIDYIKPYPLVDAHLHVTSHTREYEGSSFFPLSGWMDLKPGNHILYFPPPETDGLALSCTFDGVHSDHCHGAVLYESSQEVCAEFFLKRTDH